MNQRNHQTEPRLRLAGTLWSLAQHPSAKHEWTLRKKIGALKAAGFEGVQTSYRPDVAALAQEYGLAYLGGFDAGDPAQFARQVQELVGVGTTIANAQMGDHDTPVETAVRMAVALMAEARRQGLDLHIESHRDTATETPEKLYAIAEGYQRATGELLPITWDHSHFAVVKQLRPEEFSARLLSDAVLIQRSRYFHCRPFNGSHCQIPVTDSRGRLTREFREWLPFVRDLLALWRAGASAKDELWVVPELGATGSYNLSTFGSPWEAAKRCRDEIMATWQAL